MLTGMHACAVNSGTQPADPVLALEGATVWRSTGGVRRTVLDGVDLTVLPGEHWAVIGPNGAGKTTLLRVLSAQMLASTGTVTILGGRVGKVPLHPLRRRIGLVEPALARSFYPSQRAVDVVLGGKTGTVLLHEQPGAETITAALALLETVGIGPLALQQLAVCSEGERARILLARALLADSQLLVLDEPTAGLDLPGRELFRNAFEDAVRAQPGLATVSVSHHLEELSASTSHALLLRDGKLVAAGPIADVTTDALLGECFGLPVHATRVDGRLIVSVAAHDEGDDRTDRDHGR